VPAAGGVCQFSARVTNGLSTTLTGQAWSIVHSGGTGSFTNFTTFQTDSIQNVNLGRGKNAVLQFQFNVSGSVANGATICATVFVGQGQSPFFNPQGASTLFCIVKGDTGFTLLSEQETQQLAQQMKIQEIVLPDAMADDRK
jgi:hypothetical protein